MDHIGTCMRAAVHTYSSTYNPTRWYGTYTYGPDRNPVSRSLPPLLTSHREKAKEDEIGGVRFMYALTLPPPLPPPLPSPFLFPSQSTGWRKRKAATSCPHVLQSLSSVSCCRMCCAPPKRPSVTTNVEPRHTTLDCADCPGHWPSSTALCWNPSFGNKGLKQKRVAPSTTATSRPDTAPTGANATLGQPGNESIRSAPSGTDQVRSRRLNLKESTIKIQVQCESTTVSVLSSQCVKLFMSQCKYFAPHTECI